MSANCFEEWDAVGYSLTVCHINGSSLQKRIFCISHVYNAFPPIIFSLCRLYGESSAKDVNWFLNVCFQISSWYLPEEFIWRTDYASL